MGFVAECDCGTHWGAFIAPQIIADIHCKVIICFALLSHIGSI